MVTVNCYRSDLQVAEVNKSPERDGRERASLSFCQNEQRNNAALNTKW